MAFRGSFARMAAVNKNYTPHLKTWWKNYYHVDGQIMQHLSPYEQKIVEPLFKDLGKKLVRRFIETFRDSGVALVAAVFLINYLKSENKKYLMSHRH